MSDRLDIPATFKQARDQAVDAIMEQCCGGEHMRFHVLDSIQDAFYPVFAAILKERALMGVREYLDHVKPPPS